MNVYNIFSGAAIEAVIRGPLVWAAFIVCGLGIVLRQAQLMHMTGKRETPRHVRPDKIHRIGSTAYGEPCPFDLYFLRCVSRTVATARAGISRLDGLARLFSRFFSEEVV